MKVEERVLDVTGTLEGECIPMSVDMTRMAHIMDVLTNLYSDTELACLREYSTNAYDAHVEAGVTRPIEVTLPSPLSPFLKIRDFGLGLDADDIRNIYSKYGMSTKTESDDFNGKLGLGCKSALSYCDQFTLASTKNGVTTQVSISRDEDGAGSMTVVDVYASDEEQGTEITIPAKQYNRLDQTAKNYFRFWTEGTVLVNGEQPERVDGFWVTKDLLLTKDIDQSYVVMGNVAYPEEEAYLYRRQIWHTVAFVSIGAVEFTPSRESLKFNSKTKKTIVDIKERVARERDASLHKQINEAATAVEAVQLALNARSMEYKGEATWNGEEIPLTYKFDNDAQVIVVEGEKTPRQKDWTKYPSVVASVYSEAIILYGYESDSFSPYKRKKLEQWFAKLDIEKPKYFLLVERVPRSLRKWVNKDRIMSWTTGPEQEKIIREGKGAVPRQDGRPTGSYEGYVAGNFQHVIEAADIDYSNGLYYVHKNIGYDRKILNYTAPNATLIVLGRNRVAKFLRDFPMAQSLSNFDMQQKLDWQDGLSDDDKLWLKIYTNGRADYKNFDHTRIEDPELAKQVELANTTNKTLSDAYAVYQVLPEFEYESALNKYPLLDNIRYFCYNKPEAKDHAIIYVNAVYAAEGN